MEASLDPIVFPKVSESLRKQLTNGREKIEKWLSYICIDDDLENDEIKKLKSGIYNFYSKQVNELINKYEVYLHDFSDQVSILIMEIMGQLSGYSTATDTTKQIQCLKDANHLIYCLYFLLCLEISYYCMDQVSIYKKTLSRCNYKGVYYEPEKNELDSLKKIKFYKLMKERKKQLNEKLENYKEIFKNLIEIDGRREYIVLDKVGNAMSNNATVDDLSSIVNLADKFLKDVERHYPVIINNGYSPLWWEQILSIGTFWVLPIALAVVTLVIKFK